ncbi:ATP-binding cassette domain-containing protein [bacterium]|nr:ATP-binding cassette domain-containing protein [bacterium]
MAYTDLDNEVVKVDAVTFDYSNAASPVIDQLTLALKKSEITFLIGPSGSGKTTLLKLLAGLLEPGAGDITIQGVSLKRANSSERRATLRKVAMTFQRSGLFDSKTVLENLIFPLQELNRLSFEKALAEAGKVLDLVELKGHESKLPHEVSGGMQKRVGIGRALALSPEVVFYDDPTAGLDPITSKNIIELIIQIQKENKTTNLISTSDLDLAVNISRKIASKIAFLFEGKILQIGTADEILGSINPVIHQFTRGLLEGPLTKGAR